jgi:hypothetical protein
VWSSCGDCFRLPYIERVLPPLPSSEGRGNGDAGHGGGRRNRWSRLDEREASRENTALENDDDDGL